MNSKRIEFDIISNDERQFVKWFGEHYKNKKLKCTDYWESKIPISKIHHFIIESEFRMIHISFSKISIVCSIIVNVKKGREKDIYKGYSWTNCKEILDLYLWKK